MASMMSKDKFDRMDEMIGLIEYLASYINPEGVKRVQEARKNTSFVPDDQFLNIIEKMSGAEAARDLAAKKDIK